MSGILSQIRPQVFRGVRLAHTSSTAPVPSPRGKIQNVESFLKAIGRDCESFADKFETWESLFTTSSHVMKTEFNIPTKQRRYILSWREAFRQGREPYTIRLHPKKK